MKRAITAVVLAVFTVTLASWAPFAHAQCTNLLVNPGFEDAGGSYNGWFTFPPPPSDPQIDTTIARTGAASAKIFGVFTGCPNFPSFDVSGFGQAFTPTPGMEYELSGYAYIGSWDSIPGASTCDGNRLIAQVAFFDAATGGNVIARNEVIVGDWSTPLDQWVPFSVTALAPAGALRVEALFLFLQPGCDAGAVFVDDVSFCEKTPTTVTGNVLANPSFDSFLNGWTTFGNVYFDGRVFARRTPIGGAKLFGPFSTSGATSGMFQTFPATPGSQWTMDVYSLVTCEESPIPGLNFGVAKIVFADSTGAEIGAQETVIADANSPLGTWTPYSVTGTAPAGTDSVRAFILFVQPDSTEGGAFWVDDVSLRETTPTAVGDTPSAPGARLYQNVPNPFNPTTRIAFDLDRDEYAVLTIHDVAGRRIATLVDGQLRAGPHGVTWNGRTDAGTRAASGVYWYRLRTAHGSIARSMVLLK